MIIEHNTNAPVILGENPVLLDFWAVWCAPCRMTGKNIDEFSKAHPDVIIHKINVDDSPEIAEEYKVMSLPTLIYADKDGEIWRHNGLMTVQMLENKIINHA